MVNVRVHSLEGIGAVGDMPQGTEIDPFDQVFKTDIPRRDKFLSRLFGLFSEEVVQVWCDHPGSPYLNRGRPTLYEPGDPKERSTLDFLLESGDGRIYVAELKCELEFDNYRYLRLEHPGQLAHHTGRAFRRFLQFAKNPRSLNVRIAGKDHTADGAILVWGAITDEGREAVMKATGLADVLSVEHMIADLNQWKPEGWTALVDERRRWSSALFDYLNGTSTSES